MHLLLKSMFDVFKTAEFKRALTFYVQEVKNNRKHFLISMSSAVIWCFLVVLHPYLIKRIVDDGIVVKNIKLAKKSNRTLFFNKVFMKLLF